MVQEGVQQPWTGVCVLSCFSHVWLFVTLWTTAHQAPLSMGFLRKNTGVGCHALLQGISLTQELNLGLLHWQADSSPLSHLGSPPLTRILLNCKVISYAFFFKTLTILEVSASMPFQWFYLSILYTDQIHAFKTNLLQQYCYSKKNLVKLLRKIM